MKQAYTRASKMMLILVLIGLPVVLFAKKKYVPEAFNQSKYQLELALYHGWNLKHTKRIIPPMNETTQALEISYSRNMFGNRYFERKFNYPQIGASLLAVRFGNNEYFGEAVGVFPHMTFWIKRSKVLDFYFRMGVGLAYLTRPYDLKTNPFNNVIGSNINNITQFRWGVNWKLTDLSNINTTFNYTHYSNGHSQNPNLGINYTGFSVGYRYNIGVGKQPYNRDSVPPLEKKNYFIMSIGLGILERGKVAYGPAFNAYNFYVQYNRATGHTNQLIGGFNLTYNDMAYKEALFKENNESSIQDRTVNSLNMSVYVGDELIFHNIGAFLHVGFYLFQPYSSNNFMYQKLGLNYYFPEMGKIKSRIYTGVNIKSHLSIAESFEMRTGIRF